MRITKGGVRSFLLIATMLTGCGGGGGGDGGNSANQNAGSSTAIASRRIQISIDSSVPAAAAQAVQTVISSLGSAAAGSILSLPGLSGTEALVFAVDGQQNVMLLGFFNAQASLSVDSTAQALVRIAADAITPPPGLTTETVIVAVTNSPSYPILIAAISTALSTQQVPIQSSVVLEAVWKVAAEVIETLKAATPLGVPITAASKARPQILAATATTLPYYFWNNGADDKSWLTDIGGTPDFNFNNRSFLAWQVTTDLGFTKIVQPMSSTLGQIIGYYGGAESITKVTGPSLSETMTVTVSQSSATIPQNMQNIVTKQVFGLVTLATVGSVITPSEAQACSIRIAQTLFGQSAFSALLANPTSETLLSYLGGIGNNVLVLLSTACNATTNWTSILSVFLPTYTKVWQALNTAQTIYQAGTIAYQFFHVPTPFFFSSLFCKNDGVYYPCVEVTVDSSPQSLTMGTAMSNFRPLIATGGTAPYIYSIKSGALPEGVGLDATNGIVSGTPTSVYATAEVVFSVKDAKGVVANATSTVSFTVTNPATGFWEGTYQYTSCVVPGYSAAGDPCAYALIALADRSGGAYYGPLRFWARLGTTEPKNLRFEHRFNIGMCSAGPSVDIGATDTWTQTYKLISVFFSGERSATLIFNVSSRSPTLIRGTFSGSFEYPKSDQNNQLGVGIAQMEGTWTLTPRGGPFNKCLTNGSDYLCTSTGESFDFLGPSTGPCPVSGQAGEWEGLP